MKNNLKNDKPYKDIFKSIPFWIGIIAIIILFLITFCFDIKGDKTIFDESLVSALAFIVLIVTAIMQNIDLKNQKEELVLTRKEYAKNVEELEKQTTELARQTDHLNTHYHLIQEQSENEKTNTIINRYNALYKIYLDSLQQMREEINYERHFENYIYNEFLCPDEYTVSDDFLDKYHFIEYFLNRLVLLEETISNLPNETYKKIFYKDLSNSLKLDEFLFLTEYVENSNSGEFQTIITSLVKKLELPQNND